MERRKRNSNEGVICGSRQVETVMSEGNVDEMKDSRNCGLLCQYGLRICLCCRSRERLKKSQCNQKRSTAHTGNEEAAE